MEEAFFVALLPRWSLHALHLDHARVGSYFPLHASHLTGQTESVYFCSQIVTTVGRMAFKPLVRSASCLRIFFSLTGHTPHSAAHGGPGLWDAGRFIARVVFLEAETQVKIRPVSRQFAVGAHPYGDGRREYPRDSPNITESRVMGV